MTADRTRLSDEGDPDRHDDPEESELEIDAANDSIGGPTTGSLSAGLSSEIQPADDEDEEAPEAT